MSLQQVIDLIRETGYEVTIHDYGKDSVAFCLAVMFDDFEDLYYISELLGDLGLGAALVKEKLIFFPKTKIDAELYEYICAAGKDAD
jgi:hypothetical protein